MDPMNLFIAVASLHTSPIHASTFFLITQLKSWFYSQCRPSMVQPHFLIVTFSAQGHINPSLQFAKRLLRLGAQVTFGACVSAHRKIAKSLPHLDGLSYATFSDGYDDGFKNDVDRPLEYMAEMKRRGSQTVADIIAVASEQGNPVTCLVYSLLLPWATEVARGVHIPSILLWIQPATVLDIYYHYFNGCEDMIREKTKDPSCRVELPELPLSFTARDLPSFLVCTGAAKDDDLYGAVLSTFQEQFETLDREEKPKTLVNTFDALEPEALRPIEKLNLIAVGPMIPSAFLDEEDPSDTAFGGDLFEHKSDDYKAWLSSKEEDSVIYVSFGSISVLSGRQTEEMGRALVEVGRPFLWVIREEVGEEVSFMEEVKELGMVVGWCEQVEVLSHSAVGCFVTHCGWNSTMESIVTGVPVVAFPQWTDQGTNAKLIEEVWRKGVRVAVDREGLVERGEMKRCLEMVMGEDGEEMRTNAKKWKELARQAAREGGSSDNNLRVFVDQLSTAC